MKSAATSHQSATIFPSTGSELDEVVGGGDDIRVMFDDENGVTGVAQFENSS